MDGYKRIENCIGRYIAKHYRNPVEVGVGNNFTAAVYLASVGISCRCTDLKQQVVPGGINFIQDDIFSPDTSLYDNADLLFSVRPAAEMVPPMMELARKLNCDLVVYHLGFEYYGDGGEIINCGIILHRYNKKKVSSEQG